MTEILYAVIGMVAGAGVSSAWWHNRYVRAPHKIAQRVFAAQRANLQSEITQAMRGGSSYD